MQQSNGIQYHTNHKTIKFLWARRNTGILGNEMADKAAKEACTILPAPGTNIALYDFNKVVLNQ